MTNRFNRRLDRIEGLLNPRRFLTYTVGIDFPGEERVSWLESQEEAGVIDPNDSVVGIFTLCDLPPSFFDAREPRKFRPDHSALADCSTSPPKRLK
jgi:hypothetical protein